MSRPYRLALPRGAVRLDFFVELERKVRQPILTSAWFQAAQRKYWKNKLNRKYSGRYLSKRIRVISEKEPPKKIVTLTFAEQIEKWHRENPGKKRVLTKVEWDLINAEG